MRERGVGRLRALGSAVLVAGAVGLGHAGIASASTVVSTFPKNATTSFLPPAGGEQELGETITVPAGQSQISSFSFSISTVAQATPYTIQIYAWNGTAATGSALYTSASLSLTGQTVTVTPDLAVTPAAVYVVFLDAVTSGGGHQLGQVDNNQSYSGGSGFSHNGAPTSGAWSARGSQMTFSATFDSLEVTSAGPRGGYCAAEPVLRADGSVGQFVDLAAGENTSDPEYADATPAWYGKSYGLTCDNLFGLGYTAAGYKVDDSGNHTGTAADIYEYFTK